MRRGGKAAASRHGRGGGDLRKYAFILGLPCSQWASGGRQRDSITNKGNQSYVRRNIGRTSDAVRCGQPGASAARRRRPNYPPPGGQPPAPPERRSDARTRFV